MTDAEALRRLGAASVATLATLGPDGRPNLVPFVFALEGRTIISAVDHKPKRSRSLARLANIEADPRVGILAHHYEDAWGKLWWVRAEGPASVADRPPPHLEDALITKYAAYRETPPAGPWIIIEIERLSSWAASG